MLTTVTLRIKGQFKMTKHSVFMDCASFTLPYFEVIVRLDTVTSIYSWLENFWGFLHTENLKLEKIFSNNFLKSYI